MGSSSVTTLLFDIVAHDKASGVFKGLAGNVGASGTGFDKWKAAGVAAALAVAGATTAFAQDSVDSYKKVGGEILGLQRVMGGTAEEVSRLRFAATQSGVDIETLGKSVRIFSKNLEGSDDEGKKAAAMVAKLGVGFTDAQGRIKPMAELLPAVADKFAAMPNGPEKTALAMQLFGKAGADMIPMLNKGSAGLAELAAQSDKFGLTLSGPQLEAIKKSKAAQREWDAAIEGVKVQFGAHLLPVMNTVVTFITGRLIPGITGLTGWMQDNEDVVKTVAIAIGVLTVAAGVYAVASGQVKAAVLASTVAQWAMNSALLANPITWVVVAIVALGAALVIAYQKSETFRGIVDGAMRAVGAAISWLWENVAKPAWEGIQAGMELVGKVATWLWNNAFQPALQAIAGGFVLVTRGIAKFLDILGNIPGFEWAREASAKMQAAADTAETLAQKIAKIPESKTVDVVVGYRVTGSLQAAQDARLARVEARAGGGGVTAGVPYLVGEAGPELAVFGDDGMIIDAAKTAALMAGRPRPAVPGLGSSSTGSPANILVRVFVGGRELLEDVRVVCEEVVGEQIAGVAAGVI